jgi:hypothetical protein
MAGALGRYPRPKTVAKSKERRSVARRVVTSVAILLPPAEDVFETASKETQGGQRIIPGQDVITGLAVNKLKEAGVELKTLWIAKKMKDITGKQPSTPQALLVILDGLYILGEGDFTEDIGEVNPGVDGQGHRPPEPWVNLHQLGDAIPGIHPELDLRDPIPS